ncbi:MAG: 23S rRNA (uracil(1939)-C(5))-methyltransferase RlmD [Gammaproteobacteria bacterium]|nr:23S rRNA (uracil(1939)-C(5))-methyltransferase RlmD [Gammaproteobacteria bacterium]
MRKRKKPLPVLTETVTIDSLSHEGRGIAHINGKTTFIHNALPGENVYIEYRYCSRSYDEGVASDIPVSSTERVLPKCAHYHVCGGCQLQHMTMDLQLEYKQKVLLEQLQHFGQVQPKQILPPLSGESYGYRRKARLGVRYVEKKSHRVLVGFRERNGRFLADMQACEVLHPMIGKKIIELSELVASMSLYEHIPQIEIAIGDDKAAILLRHMRPLTTKDLDILNNFYQKHHVEIYSHPNSPESIKKLFPKDGRERLSYCLPTYHLEFLFHPTDFTQINHEMNQQMIQRTLQLLELQADETVLDLFCGIGNFTLPIARQVKKVAGIEGVKTAVDRAHENARHNHLDNVEFFVADLSQDCSNMSWAQQYYDKILLDPSRAGADQVMPLIANMQAKRIVYVSCNPSTLSRDAGILVNQYGYTLESAGLINMFPQTSHMESIALFTKV